MPDLYRLTRRFLWQLPPERAHWLALKSLRYGMGRFVTTKAAFQADDPVLGQSLWNLAFRNPVGVAAGFDKDGEVPNELLSLGFSFVEVGTITPQPQQGNTGPRLFRLNQDEAVVNRMGFPSAGLNRVLERLPTKKARRGVLGINLGKNRETKDPLNDYAEGVRRAAAIADYLVINVSSPNTPGLRDLQRRGPLLDLLFRLMEVRDQCGARPPLLVKIAPDLELSEATDIAAVAMQTAIDGIIVANTTTRWPTLKSLPAGADGGLSGRPLFKASTQLLSEIYRLTDGRIPLIGVGGISDAGDAYAKIRAGASLIQLHTGLIFTGMRLVPQVKQGLVALLKADGFSRLADAIGADHRQRRIERDSKPALSGHPVPSHSHYGHAALARA